MGATDSLVGGAVAVVQHGDVTVERRIHPSDRDGSFVTLAVRNTSDSDLSVQIQEAVSDAVDDAAPIEGRDGDASTWWFDGDRVVHEHEIAAADDRAIIYEIQLNDGVPAMALSQPAVARAEPIDHAPDSESSVGDVGEGTFWRGGATARSPTADADDRGPESPSPRAEDEETSALVDQLLVALASADDDDLAALRERLRPSQSERVRLNHFRSRVDDLEAYVDLLETFLDEHGRPGDVVDEVHEQFDEVDEQLDETERALRRQRAALDHLEDAATERQRLFESTAEQFEDDVERLERKFETLQEQVEKWHDTQRQIAAALAGEGHGDGPEA